MSQDNLIARLIATGFRLDIEAAEAIRKLLAEVSWHQEQEGEALKAAQARRVEFENVVRQRDELLAALEASDKRLHEVATICASVEQQRDLLLNNLEVVLPHVGYESLSNDELLEGDYGIAEILIPARAAIASVKGGAA